MGPFESILMSNPTIGNTGRRKIIPIEENIISIALLRTIIFIEKNNLLDCKWDGDYPSKEEICKAYDYIAISNAIKCSPCDNKRSRPTYSMWDNCPSYILKQEIEILKPKTILVLGVQDNFNCLIYKLPDEPNTEIYTYNGIKKTQIKINKLIN